MGTLLQDIKYGFRMLGRNPGFTVIVILVLTIGIGATTTMLSLIDAVLLRSAPYDEPESLISLYASKVTGKKDLIPTSYANYIDWKDQSTLFEDMAGYTNFSFRLVKKEKRELVMGLAVSYEYFPLLRIKPIKGRLFLPEEDKPGAEPVVMISYSFWQSWFCGDPDVIGKPLVLEDKAYTVIGVLDSDFRYASRIERHLYIPLTPFMGIGENTEDERGSCNLFTIARMKPGAILSQVRAEMDLIGNRLAQTYPKANADKTVSVVPVSEEYAEIVGQNRKVLYIAQGIVTFILMIACLHVASLLLIRSATREKEIAVRAALGAGRMRLIRQLLTECVLLALLGGALGLLLAHWGIGLICVLKSGPSSWYVSKQIQKMIPWFVDLGINMRTLVYVMGVSLLTCILFGLLPALRGSKIDLNRSLTTGRTPGQGLCFHGMRSALVIVDIAIAFVLLVGAGLLINSYARLSTGLGYDPENVLCATVKLDEERPPYSQFKQRLAFFDQVIERVGHIPAVQAVAVADQSPAWGGGNSAHLKIEGLSPDRYDPEDKERFPVIRWRQVSGDYFRVLDIPLLSGRYFDQRDRIGASRVAIISESMAKRFWPNEDPVGKYVTDMRQKRKENGEKETMATDYQIVGVVGNAKQFTYLKAGMPDPVIYVSYSQTEWSEYMTIMLRTKSDPGAMAGAFRSAILAVEQNAIIRDITLLDEEISGYILPQRFNMVSLCGFASVALILAGIGVYGTMAYVVSRRTNEIGIRMALGAQSGDVLKAILRQGLKLTLIGVAIGLVVALATIRIIRTLLFGIGPNDPLTIACVILVLICVALLASYIPATRAAKIDPIVALRYE